MHSLAWREKEYFYLRGVAPKRIILLVRKKRKIRVSRTRVFFFFNSDKLLKPRNITTWAKIRLGMRLHGTHPNVESNGNKYKTRNIY